MGKRGPAPTPTPLKLLKGTRPDRVNTDEPKPDDQEVRCPTWLPAKAKAVWRRKAPDLIRKKVLTHWDVEAFATYCELVVINREALEDLDKNGNRILVVQRELADGTLIYGMTKNPNWQIAKESAALLVTYGGRFGLLPSDRSQLKIPEAVDHGKGASRLLSS